MSAVHSTIRVLYSRATGCAAVRRRLRPLGDERAQHICCTGAVYGTVVVASLQPSCGTGNEPLLVHRIASAMVWSTWIFSIILWCATRGPALEATPAHASMYSWACCSIPVARHHCTLIMPSSATLLPLACCCCCCLLAVACSERRAALQVDHLCGVQCVSCSDEDRDVGEAALVHQLDVWLLQDHDAASRRQASMKLPPNAPAHHI